MATAAQDAALGGTSLVSISAARALAALCVFLYHFGYYANAKTSVTILSDLLPGALGQFGVITFFLISGHLIASLAVTSRSWFEFVTARVLRIYPAFVLAIVIVVLSNGVVRGSWPPVSWESFVLFPIGQVHRPLHVEWTLAYEVFYYAIMSLMTLSVFRPLAKPAMVAWLCCVLVAWFVFGGIGSDQVAPLPSAILSIWNLAFILGALGALFRLRLSNTLWLVAGVGLLIGSGFVPGRYQLVMEPIGIFLAFHVLIANDHKLQRTVIAARPVFHLGNWSYGLYLIHAPALIFALDLLVGRIESVLAAVAVAGVFAFVGGSVLGYVDFTLHRRLKAKVMQFTQRIEHQDPLRRRGGRWAGSERGSQ